MDHLFLNETFETLWRGKDVFKEAFQLSGESFRKVKSRHTFRFELGEQGYFAKLHTGCGWKEIFKNLFQGKMPVLGASQEYKAIRHLEMIQVPTMKPCAYASKGINPANITSFLITEELANTVSLEDFCKDWKTNPPPYHIKAKIIENLGKMIGKMHRSGLNHRDCYLCHFLLDKSSLHEHTVRLSVIDLHRAQIRKQVPSRYIIKDLSGLLFSAMDLPLTGRDICRFIQAYTQQPVHIVLPKQRKFFNRFYKVAVKLYKKVHKKSPKNL